jgi:hypothetical protein
MEQAKPELRPPFSHALLKKSLVSAATLHGTALGNIQLMDWSRRELRIEVNLGFNGEFLEAFRSVRPNESSVRPCRARAQGGAGRRRVRRSGICALSRDRPQGGLSRRPVDALDRSRNAFMGVLSVHFPEVHRPTAEVVSRTQAMATAAADELMRVPGPWS